MKVKSEHTLNLPDSLSDNRGPRDNDPENKKLIHPEHSVLDHTPTGLPAVRA